MAPPTGRNILLTGASGFVGRALEPKLAAAGWHVRCMTRNTADARVAFPERDWVQGDVSNAEDCARALRDCAAAVYLVHGMGSEAGGDYQQREIEEARRFARAAATAGVQRIVYLGGIAPGGGGTSDRSSGSSSTSSSSSSGSAAGAAAVAATSPHLRSRLAVGEELRAGVVPTIELRASMIIGHGSLSWLIVRDLAARLPVMVLPSWLRSRTEPVAIDDVLVALVAATDFPLPAGSSASFDLPGPDLLSAHQILDETARQMNLTRPLAIEVPFLTPRLSSHWVRFVTRAKWSVAREVVVGLAHDLVARDAEFWERIGHTKRLSFAQAARLALAAEQADGPTPGAWGVIERAFQQAFRRRVS